MINKIFLLGNLRVFDNLPKKRAFQGKRSMIKKLNVKNYKTLKELDLDLGNTNILVGPNMSGKTNLIDIAYYVRNYTSCKIVSWSI